MSISKRERISMRKASVPGETRSPGKSLGLSDDTVKWRANVGLI